jgi:hypothetical protein
VTSSFSYEFEEKKYKAGLNGVVEVDYDFFVEIEEKTIKKTNADKLQKIITSLRNLVDDINDKLNDIDSEIDSIEEIIE